MVEESKNKLSSYSKRLNVSLLKNMISTTEQWRSQGLGVGCEVSKGVPNGVQGI